MATDGMRASDISQERRLHELNQISDDNRIARILRASINAAEGGSNYRAFAAQFDGSYSFYHGDQWLNTDGSRSEAPPWRFRTVRNVIFGMVHSIVSLMMDMRPSPYVVADFPNRVVQNAGFMPMQSLQGGGTEYREKTHSDLASDATKMIQAEFDRTDETAHLKNLLLDMVIGGLGIEKTYWNTKTGRPAVIQIDPRDFLIDPECMSNNIYDGNASFVVWKKKMDADRLRRVYGLSKQGTKKVIGEAAAFEEASIIDDDGLYKRYEYANVFRDPHPGTADYNRPMVTVYEFWYFEDAVPGLESTEDDVKLSKFPRGRRIHLAGDTILLDGDNPFPHGELPFVMYRNYGDPRDPYAFGDVETVRGQQVALNVLQSQAMQMAILMANGQWVYEEGALRDDWLSNRPGLAIQVPRGMVNSVRKLEGINVPPTLFNMMEHLERNVEQVTNVNETMEGRSPGTHVSAEQTKTLQDAAFKRIRAKLSDVGMGRRRSVYHRFRMMQDWGRFDDVRKTGDMSGGEWMAWDDGIREMPVDIRIRSMVDEPTSQRERIEHAQAMSQLGWFDALQAVKFAELDVDDDYLKTLELTRAANLRNLHVQDMKMEIEELTVQQQRDQMLGVQQGQQQPPQMLDAPGAVPQAPADMMAGGGGGGEGDMEAMLSAAMEGAPSEGGAESAASAEVLPQ